MHVSSRTITWTASIFAVGLALVGGILPGDVAPRYRPDIAVLTATLVAIIWYTRYTFDSLQHQRMRVERELTRRRRSLSTGALAEVKRIEGSARQYHVRGPRGLLSWDRPVTEAALRNIDLFEPETADLLVTYDSRLRHLELGIQLFVEGRRTGPRAEKEIRGSAAFVVELVPELVERLVDEGGALPRRRGDESRTDVPMDLPDSPFGTFDLSTGWQ